MQKIILLFLIIALVSCKAKKSVIADIPIKVEVSNNTIKNIISNHYALKRDFKTAYIKADIDYKDDKQSLNVGLSADIRIKRNEIILVSVKFLGMTMAKAIITPLEVKYYEKNGRKFFEGDYKTLSNWLGTDLDFQKVQNMLLGQAIDDLKLGKYELKTEDNSTKLIEDLNKNFVKTFILNQLDFTLKSQEIVQKFPERKILVNYSNYKPYPESIIPGELLIFANQDNKTTAITLEFKTANFNEELTYPYSVPEGYEQIIIK